MCAEENLVKPIAYQVRDAEFDSPREAPIDSGAAAQHNGANEKSSGMIDPMCQL